VSRHLIPINGAPPSEIERLLLNLILNACRRGLHDGSEIVIQAASIKQVPPGLASPNAIISA
jgi:hypothetical protein